MGFLFHLEGEMEKRMGGRDRKVFFVAFRPSILFSPCLFDLSVDIAQLTQGETV